MGVMSAKEGGFSPKETIPPKAPVTFAPRFCGKATSCPFAVAPSESCPRHTGHVGQNHHVFRALASRRAMASPPRLSCRLMELVR